MKGDRIVTSSASFLVIDGCGDNSEKVEEQKKPKKENKTKKAAT